MILSQLLPQSSIAANQRLGYIVRMPSSSSSPSSQCLARLYLLFAVFCYLFSAVSCKSCFECSSLNETYCPEQMTSDDEGIIPYNDCSYVHGGAYCVKTIGITGVTTGELFCFVCDESKSEDYSCSSHMLSAPLTSCRNVFDSHYCIKVAGIYEGSLGTRRFCSSRDMGNYCEYIRRPGDQREYRSCVYTCTGDGCNGAGRGLSLPSITNIFAASVLSLFLFHFRNNFFSSLIQSSNNNFGKR